MLDGRLLFHEFAHHFQWASSKFPCFLPKGIPRELLPRFAKVFEIGPQKGKVWVSNLLLDESCITFLKDFSERISDSVCESILFQKGLVVGLLKEYRLCRSIDPCKSLPIESDPRFEAPVKYMRRLAIRDTAEWHSILRRVYPDNPALRKMSKYDRKWVVNLNREYANAEHAFDKNYDISMNLDCDMFKEPKRTADYIKEVANSLGIYVRTEETW